MRFIVEISMDNEGMSESCDLAAALHALAEQMEYRSTDVP